MELTWEKKQELIKSFYLKKRFKTKIFKICKWSW